MKSRDTTVQAWSGMFRSCKRPGGAIFSVFACWQIVQPWTKALMWAFMLCQAKSLLTLLQRTLNVLPRHYHAEQRLCVVGCLCDEPGASRRIKWWPPPTPWSCFPWLATTSGEDKRNASLSGCSLYKLADPSIMLQSKIFHWLGQWQRSNVNCRVAFSLCNVQICLSWHIPEV